MTPPPMLFSGKDKKSEGRPIIWPVSQEGKGYKNQSKHFEIEMVNLPSQSKTIVSSSVQAGLAA